MGMGLHFTVFIMMIALFFLVFIENGNIRMIISFLLVFIFSVSLSSYINSIKEELPKYRINEKVILPDDTWGNIDSVAYKVEGVWYNQETLKD